MKVTVGTLVAALGLGVLAAPLAVDAQRAGKVRLIAFLGGDTPLSRKCTSTREAVAERAFLEGLQALGYRDGENITLECRSADGKYERLDALAAELVRLKPAVLVAGATPASLAAKRATSSIPIISVYTADPVSSGLVASLARPGGNVTGISALASDYAGKSLQLLKEAAPRTSRVGVLGHAANPTYAIYARDLEPAGRALGIALEFGRIQTLSDVEGALAAMKGRGVDAVLVMHQPITFVNRADIVSAVARLRVPAMYGSREAVELGGLMSYAVSIPEVFRRAAFLVDRVLHGVKPAELPVEQPTSFQLALNRKTARSLGLTLPPSLLLRAELVVE